MERILEHFMTSKGVKDKGPWVRLGSNGLAPLCFTIPNVNNQDAEYRGQLPGKYL